MNYRLSWQNLGKSDNRVGFRIDVAVRMLIVQVSVSNMNHADSQHPDILQRAGGIQYIKNKDMYLKTYFKICKILPQKKKRERERAIK